jgi:uncharacterized RDD family membrane protein YckC
VVVYVQAWLTAQTGDRSMNMPPPPPPIPPSDYSGLQGVAPGGKKLAQPWMRILARFLDAIIVSVIGTAIGAAIILSGDDSAGFAGFGGDIDAGDRFALSLFSLAIGFVYEAVLTKVKGGTPMKLAFGMQVVRVDGSPVGWSESIIRWGFLGLISVIPILGGIAALIIWIISIVFLFTDRLRQTVSDKVAKTW